MLRIALLLACAVALATVRTASARECQENLNEAYGYTIRSVRVEGRWVPPLVLPIKAGDRFSNQGVSEAMEAVQRALRTDRQNDFELQNLGAAGVVHITSCLVADARQVDVVIEAHAVRVDLFKVGSNVLPIPRSAVATFYQAVPAPLRALNPVFGAYQDRAYGFAPTAAISAELSRDGKATDRGTMAIAVTAEARKSVEHSFYDADARFAFSTTGAGQALEQLAITAGYSGKDEPHGDATFSRQAGELSGKVRWRPRGDFVSRVHLGADYRFSENRFTSGHRRDKTSEHAGQLHLLADARVGDAFLRGALWGEAGVPDKGSSYQRLAGLAAIEKEFLIAPNQSIGVEAVIGAGKAWSAPRYAEFYGGNAQRNFLYDTPESVSLAVFPQGPIIRSFGAGQALTGEGHGDRGCTAYWHINLNVSIPIPKLSAPLLPNEDVAGTPLRQVLKNKAHDFVVHEAVGLVGQGYTRDEAMAKANTTYNAVRPAVEFIADRANIYAVKPVLLFDLAGQDEVAGNHRLQAAVGGGLQLTIVTAKMELGYMQTVLNQGGTHPGNLFARIVFQNLF